MAGGEGRERHHRRRRRCGRTSCPGRPAACGRRVGLQIDPLDPAAVDEVVDVVAAPGGRQRGVDVGEVDAERAGLLLVDVDRELRLVFLAVRAHVRRAAWVLRGQAEQLVARCDQRVMAERRRCPAARSRSRWRCRAAGSAGGASAKTCASRDLAEGAHGAAARSPAPLCFGRLRSSEVLQLDEGDAGILARRRRSRSRRR